MSKLEEVRLGEYIHTLKGNAFKSSLYKNNGIPVVRASNFTDESIEKDKIVYIDYDEDYDRFIVKKRDVLCQTVGSWLNNPNSLVGKIVRVPDYLDGSYLNQNIVKIIPDENLDNDYLFYRLKVDDYKHYCVDNAQGAANQASITLKTIRRFKFSLPALETQKKIANVLSTYDELIENNNRRIEILEKTADEIYKEWFVRMRFPGHENTKFIKGLPEGWEVSRVGDIVNRLQTGYFYKEEELLEEGEVIVIDQSVKEYMGFHNGKPTHTADIENPIILFGDHSCKMLAITRKFSLGENVVPFISSYNHPVFFLYYSLKGLIQTEEYKRHWKELISKKIYYPELWLQERFRDTIKENMNLIEKYKKQNENLIKQRDLLLPRLMNGTIEVK